MKAVEYQQSLPIDDPKSLQSIDQSDPGEADLGPKDLLGHRGRDQ